ncbi:hypothetical protein [Bradyrhizobium sp. ERR14]|uniref:hypothetical protein n=1 Tax=Bradyrhizobium sp. ERR14 TaxID=2663837 RepID=UPI001609F997|nr:hypothetical protein [Bradyrhizobium sp. ERR14]MBB4391791.1 hypothetical protein [Bradyrhizobium sp. ERR14]
MKSLLAKEVLKRIALGLLALVGGWVWAVLLRVFDEASTGVPFFERLKQIFIAIRKDPLDFSLQLLFDYPGQTFLSVLLIGGYLVLFAVIWRTRRTLRVAQIERTLAVRAGIGGWWPNAKPGDDGSAPWADLCAEIARPENRTLLVLGANGIDTFGRPGAPLHDVLQAFRGTVRVILAHPDSEQTKGRAAAVGVKAVEYKRAITTSVALLRDLRRQHHAVDGRFYDGQPNWKMIITSRTAWIQYYAPGQHVDGSPVWRFDGNDDGSGLYYLFAAEFERIWRRCEEHEMF